MISMSADTLTADVLDEAESLVHAEWLRMMTDAMPEHVSAEHTEMPVARPRPRKPALRTGRPRRPGMPPPAGGWRRSGTRRRNRWVWPTQRSPPGACTDAHRT